MINTNYANTVEQAKAQPSQQVNVEQSTAPIAPITAQQDTVTLSKQAQELMQGGKGEVKEAAPTYQKPATASELLAASSSSEEVSDTATSSILLDKLI